MVIRVPYAGGIGGVEHHCDSSEAYYAHTPGLHVVAPATAAGRLRAAARGDRLRRPGRVPRAQEALLGQGGGRSRRGRRRASARAVVRPRGHRRDPDRLRAVGPGRAGGRRGRRAGGPQPAGRRPALDRAVRRRDGLRGGPLDRPGRGGRRGVRASPASPPRSSPGSPSAASTRWPRRSAGSPGSTSRTRRRSWSTSSCPGVDRVLDAVDDLQWDGPDERPQTTSCCPTWARG